MRASRYLALPALAGLALAPLVALFLGARPAVASGGTWTPLADADGDGLEDALEDLLGTDPNQADGDLDGYTDAEEVLLGSDPAVPASGALKPRPVLHMDIYHLGDRAYVQIFVLHRSALQSFQLGWADRDQQLALPDRYVRRWVARSLSFPTAWQAWTMEVATLSLPWAWFNGKDSLALGLAGVVDGQTLGASVQLVSVGGVLAQFRPDATYLSGGAPTPGGGVGPGPGSFFLTSDSGGDPGGSAGGGLFPVEPGDGGGGQQGTVDEVCVQLLQPIGYLGGARILYQVLDASCDPMPGALCLTGCDLTRGSTVVGLDPVGLLPG